MPKNKVRLLLAGLSCALLASCGAGGFPPPPDENAFPPIVLLPATLTVTEPQAARFEANPSGSPPFTYQWRRNGVAIAGATSNVYTLATTSRAADNGARFSVTVTNHISSDTSNDTVLTVNAP